MEHTEYYPLALPRGTVLAGQYIIRRVLGEGGFGITYEAEDHRSGQTVAIKEYFPDSMATRTEKTRVTPFSGDRGESYTYGKDCFLQEAETLARFIGNENIVRVFTYFEENNTAYFVMDFVRGKSLVRYLKDRGGRIPYEEAERILIPIMDALEAVHAQGIIHRDIAPDNIYITEDGRVKLLDFGAARFSIGDKSRSLDIVLKPGYAPTEQYSRHGRQGPHTDIYALGATFYNAITGRRPLNAVDRLDEDKLAAPSSLGVRISQGKEDVILKAMSVHRKDRYASMREFKEALLSAEGLPPEEDNRETQTPAGLIQSEMPQSGSAGSEPSANAFIPQPVQNETPQYGPAQSDPSANAFVPQPVQNVMPQYGAAGNAPSPIAYAPQHGSDETEMLPRGVSGFTTERMPGPAPQHSPEPEPEKERSSKGLIIALVSLGAAALVFILVLVIWKMKDDGSDTEDTDNIRASSERDRVATSTPTMAPTPTNAPEVVDEPVYVPTATPTVYVPPEGDVLNIYCWNEEFKSRVSDHYPGYVKVDDTHGKIGDIEVVWTIVPSDDNAYLKNLDNTLSKQDSAAADARIDMFLVEADYALKYVDTDYTLPVTELGIDLKELENQYKYTQDVMTSSDGKLKGVSWQGCPGVLIYNRAIAKQVLGSDSPSVVQESVKDWDTYRATAAKMRQNGYYMTATVNDAYRVYSNNVSRPWVDENKRVHVDDNIKRWVDDSKAMYDAAQIKSTEALWGDAWSSGFYPDGRVFCYFGPAWMIDFCMGADTNGSIANKGGWGATEGPQSFFWGGTWICAAAGTDNKGTVADIMRALTVDEEIMIDIVKQDDDFVNNKPAMEAMAKSNYSSAVFGGQNPLGIFSEGAKRISLTNITPYDQGCNEEFQNAMKRYFDGVMSYADALAYFKNAITNKYPALIVD